MRLANPIYDVVFKYLMEDTDIAKRFLSKLIGEEIVELTLQPQERSSRSERHDLLIFRMDFAANIKTKEGKFKRALIELQKGKEPNDIPRFRRYLAKNYGTEQPTQPNFPPDPIIILVYFLGYRLSSLVSPVVKINREYIDLITNQRIEAKEEFVEKLTHDAYVIQVRRLKKKVRTELERLLKVFDQSYVSMYDRRVLEINEKELEGDELLHQMAERLRKAASDEEMLETMELVEEVESILDRKERAIQELEEKVEEKEKAIAQKNEMIEEQANALEAKERALTEQAKLIEQLKAQLQHKK